MPKLLIGARSRVGAEPQYRALGKRIAELILQSRWIGGAHRLRQRKEEQPRDDASHDFPSGSYGLLLFRYGLRENYFFASRMRSCVVRVKVNLSISYSVSA